MTLQPFAHRGGAPCSSRWPETLDPEKGASRPEKGASQGMKTDRETAAVALARCSVGSSVGRPLALMETAKSIELFVSCESSYPLLSVKRDNGDIEKAAETVSAFLGVPSATPQVIIDKAKECFSALKGERAMMTVDFERVELRCGVGPDIQWGRVVVVRVN